MAKKAWPALEPCHHKRHKANGSEPKDRLSDLPDDILLSILIMASFSVKEVAQISLLSRRWKHLWGYFPILNFEDSRTEMEWITNEFSEEIICRERSNFAMCLNRVLDKYLGSAIDEFRVAFDFGVSFQSHINKWVAFALEKQVKKLELDFTEVHPATYDISKPGLTLNIGVAMPVLTSLCLNYVSITGKVVKCLLHSCPLLENLSISNSEKLTIIRASCSALQLKYLKVSRCWKLKTIDISAPKLLSFKYDGRPVKLHIRNAASLSEVLIGGWRRRRSIAYAFDSLSEYFSQLECLDLLMSMYDGLNMGMRDYPALTNLKHLVLTVKANSHQTLLGWTGLIEAAPLLQKLTLQLGASNMTIEEPIGIRGRPLKCLKTLEIVGFLGCYIDLEFATYVFKNAIVLEEVIIGVRKPEMDILPSERCFGKVNTDGLCRIWYLERRVPPGVRLTIKQ